MSDDQERDDQECPFYEEIARTDLHYKMGSGAINKISYSILFQQISPVVREFVLMKRSCKLVGTVESFIDTEFISDPVVVVDVIINHKLTRLAKIADSRIDNNYNSGFTMSQCGRVLLYEKDWLIEPQINRYAEKRAIEILGGLDPEEVTGQLSIRGQLQERSRILMIEAAIENPEYKMKPRNFEIDL